jgi:hypothetical protein
MFRIATEPVGWSADQAAALRQFLSTPSGQIFLQRMFQDRPAAAALPPPGISMDPERAKAEANRLLGYEDAIQNIIHLTVSPD